jgi:hypothetical protein
MHGRPDLAGFTLTSRSSIYTSNNDVDSISRANFFFTPSVDKNKVYQRLAERLCLLLGHETPLSEAVYDEERLLDLCAGVWGMSERASLQLAAVVGIWREKILKSQTDDERVGSAQLRRNDLRELKMNQDAWGARVIGALRDLETDIADTLDEDHVSFQRGKQET